MKLLSILPKTRNDRTKSDTQLRVKLFAGGLAFAGIFMTARYAQLSVLPTEINERLRSKAVKQFESEIKLYPPRGKIVDRNGRTLAVSVLYPSLFAIPKRLPKDKKTLKNVAHVLDVPLKTLVELQKTKRGFAWLRRHVEPSEFEKMGDIAQWRDFIGIAQEPKRIYPEKEAAAHLIGFVGIDNVGLEGVESVYNSSLNGSPLIAKVTRDARGDMTLISPNGAAQPENEIAPLSLSIDLSIQTMTENALREGVKKAKARAGSAVVMDVSTGEILSIASYPAYDLNRPPSGQPHARRFRPLMDALELGSVVKPLFIAKAIDKKRLSARERLYCENGVMTLPGGKIRDTHPHKYLTPQEIIKVSSNICTYKIAQKLGRNVFYDALSSFGLIRAPGTGLPGEWGGRVGEPESWSEMRFANMSFGQGIAISPLQLTRSIAILANDGTDPGIRILAQSEHRNGASLQLPPLKVLSPQTARLVTKMMTTVVEEDDGTGQLAAIPGISVAGKTGTAQKYDPKTRSYSERIAAFTGIIPANRPKLAITVVIDEPQVRPAYGGLLAGPVFSEIGHKSINYLNSQGLIQLDSESKNILKSPLAERMDARGTNARN